MLFLKCQFFYWNILRPFTLPLNKNYLSFKSCVFIAFIWFWGFIFPCSYIVMLAQVLGCISCSPRVTPAKSISICRAPLQQIGKQDWACSPRLKPLDGKEEEKWVERERGSHRALRCCSFGISGCCIRRPDGVWVDASNECWAVLPPPESSYVIR